MLDDVRQMRSDCTGFGTAAVTFTMTSWCSTDGSSDLFDLGGSEASGRTGPTEATHPAVWDSARCACEALVDELLRASR
jgi:hypothetical protein